MTHDTSLGETPSAALPAGFRSSRVEFLLKRDAMTPENHPHGTALVASHIPHLPMEVTNTVVFP